MTILRLTRVTKESTKAVNDRPHSDPSDPALVKDRKVKMTSAGMLLKSFIDPRDVLRKEETMWRPFIIFSFDEAHNLTNLIKDQDWTIYLILRGCLTHLVAFPFFFVFLSTAGKFCHFSPEAQWDPSSRVSGGVNLVLPPITETGFDQLAPTACETQTTLEEVVTDEWISHLGRPLYVFYLAHSVRGLIADST